jgi:hypothetical protein
MMAVESAGGPVMPEMRDDEELSAAERMNRSRRGPDFGRRKDASGNVFETDIDKGNRATGFDNLSTTATIMLGLAAQTFAVSVLALVMFLGALAFTDATPLSAGIVGGSVVVAHAIATAVRYYLDTRQEVARRAESLRSAIDDDLARLKSLRRRLLED